mmetsp:Transcript_31191/g.30622  ORF Transcript_31191/g.30622 Transcript_31191/m.30622 type:complete len:89 (+) Transcript_31191:408-674(+)
MLQNEKQREGQKYHCIDPSAFENRLMVSVIQAQNLEGDPQLIVYIYVDRELAFKTKAYPKSSNPYLNLDIDIMLPSDASKLAFEIYDA